MLYSNNTEIVFYEAIQKIIKRSPDLLSKNVQIYLVYLMTNSAENFSINKVFDYIPSDCDKTTLLEMGDNILFATGYFQEYFLLCVNHHCNPPQKPGRPGGFLLRNNW